MKKRTCYGCRALDYVVYQAKCELGYSIEMKDNSPLLPKPVPIDKNCPKPLTYSELSRLLDEKELKR